MSAPASPSNYYIQQANNKVYLLWDITSGATSYSIQRSTDGVTFSALDTTTDNYYLDEAVTEGVKYYYQIASVNDDGTSAYTEALYAIPAFSGKISLAQARVMSQEKADRLGSNFVTLPEWNGYIRQSYLDLYNKLVTAFEDYYLADPLNISLTSGEDTYPLPNGNNYDGAPPFYKLRGVDLAVNVSGNAYVTLNKFNFNERNRYVYPNSNSVLYGVTNLRYRTMGNNLQFIPAPSGINTIRLWYIPRLQEPLEETDLLDGVSGWLEYVFIDAAIKALTKEESDTSALQAQKAQLLEAILTESQNRDVGEPNTIQDTRNDENGWGPQGWNGPIGGF